MEGMLVAVANAVAKPKYLSRNLNPQDCHNPRWSWSGDFKIISAVVNNGLDQNCQGKQGIKSSLCDKT